MKYLIILFSVILLFNFSLEAQEERKVLVEVFTNSHCGQCPVAHNVIDNYLSGTNGNKISYIFYHMLYPYDDDPLYWDSQTDSDARDNYYGPFFSTPRGFFDGVAQGSSSGWTSNLDNLVATESPLKIILSGSRSVSQFNINVQLMRTGYIADNDLVMHFVVVEDIFYDGRNSVSNHKHVLRKMLPTSNGQSFSISLNETINIPQTIELDSQWDADSLNIVVFVQSAASKTVYQSATIGYDELSVTNVQNENSFPSQFKLEQNYPNPFNPSTVIGYQLPVTGNVKLKVYNLLGREVAILVDEYKPAGNYEVEFSSHSGEARNLPAGRQGLTSGVYFYTLTAGEFSSTKKLILLK
jgi:hypothetical protein